MIRASEIAVSRLRSYQWLDLALGGGLACGQSYIMYGNYGENVMIIYMVSASGRVIYINSTDYYSKRNLINVDAIAREAKARGIDANQVLKDIIEISAHSPQRLLNAVKQAISAENVKLIVLHGINSFPKDPKSSETAFYALRSAAAIAGVPFLAVEDKPEVTPIMASMCGCMVAVDRVMEGIRFSFSKPAQAQLTVRWESMGRLTPSFRKRYEDYIDSIRREFEPLLRDGKGETMENMIELVWNPEMASMAALNMPQVSDAMAFVSMLYLMHELSATKKSLDEVKEKLKLLQQNEHV
ncbi:MAG: hypothetical protein M1291_02800 [Thaumarchaeota archaeon]|nr:hypothetical protein [Nitrososphaerota archaeon]MDG6932170.1 hypothetical protein [Nitrososphaerota archaeon]